jgi:hypothetical protein
MSLVKYGVLTFWFLLLVLTLDIIIYSFFLQDWWRREFLSLWQMWYGCFLLSILFIFFSLSLSSKN